MQALSNPTPNLGPASGHSPQKLTHLTCWPLALEKYEFLSLLHGTGPRDPAKGSAAGVQELTQYPAVRLAISALDTQHCLVSSTPPHLLHAEPHQLGLLPQEQADSTAGKFFPGTSPGSPPPPSRLCKVTWLPFKILQAHRSHWPSCVILHCGAYYISSLYLSTLFVSSFKM